MKKVKGKSTRPEARDWWRKNRLSCLILAAAVVLFFAVRAAAVSREVIRMNRAAILASRAELRKIRARRGRPQTKRMNSRT